jgi:hypothetical protein
MASRIAMNNLRNLPVKTVAVMEGTVVKSDAVSPLGGIVESVITRSGALRKGALVIMERTATSKLIPVVKTAGTVAAATPLMGILVSEPQGQDPAALTGAGDIPSVTTDVGVARLRRADVAFFGLAIVELDAAAIQSPGDVYKIVASTAAPSANGSVVVLRYAAAGEKVPVLVGHSGVVAA